MLEMCLSSGCNNMKLVGWICRVIVNSEVPIMKPLYVFVMNGIYDFIGSCHVYTSFIGQGLFEKLIFFYHVRKSHIIEPEGQEHFHRACYLTLPYSVFGVSVNYSLSCVIYNYIRLCVFVQPCYPQVCLHSNGLSSVVTNWHLYEKIEGN